jgi:hypothetical protein
VLAALRDAATLDDLQQQQQQQQWLQTMQHIMSSPLGCTVEVSNEFLDLLCSLTDQLLQWISQEEPSQLLQQVSGLGEQGSEQ